MNPEAYVELVKRSLAPLAGKARAAQMRAYLRNQFTFLGIQAPVRQRAVSSLPKHSMLAADVIRTATLLWEEPEREYRYTAVDLLDRNAKLLCLEDLDAIRVFVQTDSWWETVDGLAGVVGRILRAEKSKGIEAQRVMDSWVVDPDFWVRRVAMIHQLGWRMETDTERLFGYAEVLAHEKEFFIRKAVGWALRDFSRWNPEAIRRYMRKKGRIFSSLTFREATKRLSISRSAHRSAARAAAAKFR